MDFHVTIALLLVIFTERTDTASHCLSYPDPKNGYITCDSLFHLFCSPECHPGYRFATKPAVVYMCGPVTGEWFTYPVGSALPWPDCIPEDRSDNDIHKELAKKREEMTRYISDSHTGIPSPYSQARRIDPEERYHHLFDYIERAQKAYESREAIEKETEKLKQENVAAKENIAKTQNNSYKSLYGSYEPSSTPSKIPLSYADGFVARKDNVSQYGFPKVDLPKQSLFAQNAQITNYNLSAGYNNYLPLAKNNIPARIDRTYGFSPQKSIITEKLGVSSSQPNLQARNFQLNNAKPSMANTVDKKISPFKKDTNFVLKMLNNEEFKDLHYLDEHVRLNRDAQTSLNRNSTKFVLQNDKGVGRDRSDNNQHVHLAFSSGDSKDDLRDNFTEKANKETKEHENMSGYVQPIVMSRTSLLDSVASLLKKDDSKNAKIKKNGSILNSQEDVEQKQQRKITKFKNKTFDFQRDFSSRNNDGIFSLKKSEVQLNQNRQNILGSSDVLNSSNTMKKMYKSWLKKHEDPVKLYTNEQGRKNISLQTNPLPRKRVNSPTVQNVINVAAMKRKQEIESSKGREKSGTNKQTVQEHIFYFPIKKNTLFEILNETNSIPKS